MDEKSRLFVSGLTICLACFAAASASSQSVGNPLAEVAVEQEMILIPSGEFTMGVANDLADNPPHIVRVTSFLLDKYEVTNAQYLSYCESTGAELPGFWGFREFRSGLDFPNHPVVGVSWYQARAYAEWVGKRLPTEAEWEYAARGGLMAAPYPHGTELTNKDANFWPSEGTVRVGTYPANGFALHDMAGNVAEWVADLYDADYYVESPTVDPAGPTEGRFRVIRGGGWHSGPNCIRVAYRNALPPGWIDFAVGFRCARDAPPVEPDRGPASAPGQKIQTNS